MGLRTPLDVDDVAARLAERPGWHGDVHEIRRTYRLDYDSAMKVVAEIAPVAVELEHRPDIDIRWGALTVAMTTHTAGGVVTDLDFLLVDRIDAIADNYAG